MTRRFRRAVTRRRHRVATLLIATGLAASSAGFGVASAASNPSPISTPPISVSLSALRPIAPQPGDTLVLHGELTNNSAEPVRGLAIQLRMGGAISARSTFDSYAADPTGSVGSLPISLTPAELLPTSDLAAGQHESFTLRSAMNPATTGLPATSWQVRELGLEVTGLTSFGAGTVGSLRTFLPWAPRTAIGPLPLKVAWLWPLADRPHRDSSAVWRDDDLATELRPTGRLGGLVEAAAAAEHQAPAPPPLVHGHPAHRHKANTTHPAAKDVSLTWAVDPMLLDDANTMRSSYQVAHAPKPVNGAGTSAAPTWLGTLRSATASAEVLPLPYGDPDVAAAVRNGLATLVGVAATTGKNVIEKLLPSATQLSAGWPPGGFLDQHAVDALFSDGATNLVLSDAALPPVIAPNETPSALASLVTAAGTIPTALYDSILSTAMSEGADTPGYSRITLQRYLAETLMIEAEAPSDQRSIIVAPARRWAPAPTLATDLLADTGKVPWLTSTTVGTILAGPADTTIQRQPLTYPDAARHAELPAAYVRGVARQQHMLSQLTNILPPGDSETRPFSIALLRALASAWRGEPAARHIWLNDFAGQLNSMISGVRIVSAPYSTVTLTGHGGKVPVTLANDLNAPVNITVQLENATQRLALPHHGRVTVSIPANRQTTVDVHAVARTSGVFPLQIQLLTPSGQKYGAPVQLYVRSTVYGTITLVITGAATAALLVAVGIRLTRRARAARRAGASTP